MTDERLREIQELLCKDHVITVVMQRVVTRRVYDAAYELLQEVKKQRQEENDA